MLRLTTGPIDHQQLHEEAHFIQDFLAGAGARVVSVCCGTGVHVDHPLFARDVTIEVGGLSDYLLGHEKSGAFRFGQTNISLTHDEIGLEFSFGNDDDIFCEGEESPGLVRVHDRWSLRYPHYLRRSLI